MLRALGFVAGLSALAATLQVASPAFADAPPEGGYGRPRSQAGRTPMRPWPGYARRHQRPHAGYGYGGASLMPARPSVYGPEPHYYGGHGGASPNAGFGAFHPQPVAIAQYREAYIGRGLFYNTPPQPSWPSYGVISVRY